jgi:poly(beta-D-mannuronate) lyase
MRIFFTCALILLFSYASFATEFFVSSASEIHSAMNSAQPGDTLTMTAGTWTDQQIYFSGNGVEGDSIMLRTEIPGHVILNGSSNIRINGTYLKVDGLRFIGGYNLNSAIEFTSGSHHCRVTNTVVAEFNPPNAATRYHWVEIKGSHHRLDHSLFKGMRHSGVTVLVSLSSSPYGFHRIDHNHFADKSEGNGNGYESLKLAAGAYSDLDGNISAEYNYFYRCDGEMEILSNKCHNNIYRYNTFVECMGTLTLRQGNNCIVEGNYFFGNGVPNTGGIRITHRGHKIINNYLQDLGGDGQRSAISLYAGMDNSDYVPDDGGHVRADSALVAHNTIVNCAEGIYSGAWDSDDLIILPPKDNIVANNIVTMNNTAKCYARDPNHAGLNEFWEGNMLYGAQLGDVPDSGYVIADPALNFIDGWYQITGSSPAVNAATGYYPDVNDDIDGIVRDAQKDIGADEVGSGPRQPLTSDDVGPVWLRGSGVPCVMTIKFGGEGSGSVVSNPPGNIYTAGSKVTLTAIPNANHSFAGWTGDVESMENPLTVVMNGDLYITAVFNLPVRYNLSVWKIGSGTVEFNPPGGSYPESTVVKISAIPADGWTFSHWGGALTSTNNPDSLLMDSNKGLTVTFIQSTNVVTGEQVPLAYCLNQNYPNPFNPKTTITFSLKKAGFATLCVYDVTGCKVAEIVNRNLDAGLHRFEFDASALASGVYFYKITTAEFNSWKKMILLR